MCVCERLCVVQPGKYFLVIMSNQTQTKRYLSWSLCIRAGVRDGYQRGPRERFVWFEGPFLVRRHWFHASKGLMNDTKALLVSRSHGFGNVPLEHLLLLHSRRNSSNRRPTDSHPAQSYTVTVPRPAHLTRWWRGQRRRYKQDRGHRVAHIKSTRSQLFSEFISKPYPVMQTHRIKATANTRRHADTYFYRLAKCIFKTANRHLRFINWD